MFDDLIRTIRVSGIERICFLLLVPAFIITGCVSNTADIDPAFHFSLVDESQTHIGFNNKLTESDSLNFLTNQYIYIGSGVGIADFNGDGLQDVFFAGEQVSCKLYLNKGNFEFEDITQTAGVKTDRWCTGVSIVDINSDGRPDIYVSVSHSPEAAHRRNLLFINQSDSASGKKQIRFSEQAADYGLDDPGFSTQSVFFDYDRDGDLDMYLMNHNVFQNQPNNIIVTDAKGSSIAADKLFRNDGIQPGKNHPVYKDVSAEAGIRDIGYGLGLVVSDFNKDGWPDVYVANDFLSNDLMWYNNRNGTFVNSISRSMHHQSYNSMGTDAADINNDLLPDVAVLDMQPETNYRKKTMFAGTNPIKYEMEQKSGGYQPQFTRNMLQLNQGDRIVNGKSEPFFSEIGQLAGISETDWSWSVLISDFDNDGWKDIQVTNGIAKDLTNNDFLFFRSGQNPDGNPAIYNKLNAENPGRLRQELDAYGSIKIENYFYHNNRDLTFSNTTKKVGMSVPSVSHGAAYGDLDNDGDLDLVVNNMNQEAFIWKNELRQSSTDSINNFLSIQFKGNTANQSGIGANVTLYAKGKVQFLEQYPVRGYLSTMDSRLHFGVGDLKVIDSVKIVWPDSLQQVLRNIKANQFITVNYNQAAVHQQVDIVPSLRLFEDSGDSLHIFFKHDEMSYFDYDIQRLLPQKYSQLGPALATADVNGDGLTDFFVGGASYQSGTLFIQKANGDFTPKDLLAKNKTSEDVAAVFFDADGDKDYDLLITEGSSEFGASRTLNIPRLYTNDGDGNFEINKGAIPESVTNISQAIAIGDYDGDGDDDIFIGGRILPNQYPLSPRSYILQNNNGVFSDVTTAVSPILERPGLITSAVWMDFDKDNQRDLVICGEWMPIRIFKNDKGKLQEITSGSGLEHLRGLWRSLQCADIDNDGDLDLIAGNMGNNNKFHASRQQPMMLFAKDIDGNEAIDLIPAYYIMNKKGTYDLFPAIDRTELSQEIPTIKKRYLLNEDYADVTIDELLAGLDKKDMITLKCDTTASLWIENKGKGFFTFHSLPLEAQFAPVNAIVANDVDHDGNIDLLLAGNEYQVEIGSGRYDASYGIFLRGDGRGNFKSVPPVQSGLILEGDVKGLAVIRASNGGSLLIAAINNSLVKCFKISLRK